MKHSLFPKFFIHIFGRIPADTIVIKLYPVIGEALDKTLITLDPLHIIIFEYTANPAVSVLNQYFCQLICSSGILHLHTVK